MELLATLVAAKLWTPISEHISRGTCWISDGSFDKLRQRNCVIQLEWVPREHNQLADDLTNEKFDSFPRARRVHWEGRDASWLVLDQLLVKSKELLNNLHTAKLSSLSGNVVNKTSQKRKLKCLDPW